MTADQDPVVARALADLHVPDHAPGFWERLDQRLEEQDAARRITPTASRRHDPPRPSPPTASTCATIDRTTHPRRRAPTCARAPASSRASPSSVLRRPPRTGQKIWFAAAAALLVVAASSIALAAADDDDDPETASPASESTETSEQ